MSHLSFCRRLSWGLGSAWLMSLSLYANAEISIPSTPLGATMAAKPMTLLVAGKDHRLFYEAYNDASDIDGDGTLDIRFKPSITYYGLFDPKVCYTYSGSGNNGLFSPSSATADGKCPGKWSGNWLNYITTSRIDALRKVLYGGYREVDSTTETILRRAYIPQDAHSWAKEYTSESVDGYKISDYTPLSQPNTGMRHFFGNLTNNADTNCVTLSNCSNLPPLLSVVTNSTKRVWDWASKERPVLDNSHGGTRTDYTVRVKVCTSNFHNGCKQYPNGQWKPIGILHEYGENDAMLFGLLTGSYNKNMSGGVLRKVVSSFANEVNPQTGQFTANATIVQSFNALGIRDYNNNRTDRAYRGGWVATRPMNQGEFVDWGNPVGEMLYEGLRYFAGKSAATAAYATSGSYDQEIGLPVASWDDPYGSNSSAHALWCAKSNLMLISDINVSFDSDQVPGCDSNFGSFSGDLSGLNVKNEADTITTHEPDTTGLHFIGQSGSSYDSTPSPKNVVSLGSIRGLAPEEPTKQGSYYSAAVAYFGKRADLRPDLNDGGHKQTTDLYAIVLASPLPRIEAKLSGGSTITLVPFAKSVGGCFNISSQKGQFQPTNQIVDLYVENIANSGSGDYNPQINGGRYYAKFRINYEDVEQGADHDMDVIAEYTVEAQADNRLKVTVRTTYEAGCVKQNVGYIISGSTQDGVYLVAQDEADDISYFLNVPPNRAPGYCDQTPAPSDCKRLPCATGRCSNQPGESVRIFSPGSSAASLLKDPLWYAAKWGGFVDKNGNDLPDLGYEWDTDNNGVPDTYFLVQNPLKLKETLRRALEDIIARSMSAGNITANSTQLQSDSRVYRATFNTQYWSGELTAYPVTSSGVGINPDWIASANLPSPSARKIFITRKDGQTKEFLWNQLGSADQTALGNSNILDYLRGVRTQEQPSGNLRKRESTNVIGDIVHSSPVYVKDTDTVYIGANDGMLHAFNASTGDELFAYIPKAVIDNLKRLSEPNYSHRYYVDGEIAISNKELTDGVNYLVSTLGHGGKGLFALDVSNPASFGSAGFKWDYFNTADNDLGLMLGRPVIAKMNNGDWAVIVGNGYNSTSGKAVLYIFKLTNGALLKKIDTNVGSDNGLATPGIFDADQDGDIDYIYAGDLKGNVWKFDVSGSNPMQWDSAFKQGNTPVPFFVAKDANGNRQPITAQITIAIDSLADDPNYGKRFIFFGTGSYFRTADSTMTQVQSWYGLIDEDAQIAGRAELVQRAIYEEGTFEGKAVRTFAEATPDDMEGKKGWYLDFNTQSGERIVTSSKLYQFVQPTLVASSIIPIDDPCVPGGRGYINFINPFTGGRLTTHTVDINKNSEADDKLNDIFIGGVDFEVGMPAELTIIGNIGVVSGTGGQDDTSLPSSQARVGRQSWREIIAD